MNARNTAKTFTLLSVIIGYSLIDNLSALEQNALGNFFMEICQILETNSAILQSLSNNQNKELNANEIDLIKDAINKINKKLDSIKKDIE